MKKTESLIILNKRFSGTTLIELTIASVMCWVAIIGAMGFQYHTAADARKADAQANATRIALSILETWRGTGGNSSFNPKLFCSELIFDNSGTGPAGYYGITEEGIYFYASLSDQAATSVTPKKLNVYIGWKNDYKSASISDELANWISLTSYINN